MRRCSTRSRGHPPGPCADDQYKAPTDAAFEEICRSGFVLPDPSQADFLKGNIKARQRMIAQFALTAATLGLVIGTDHAAE
jgi:NAD+ synthase